jgi:uncharacterized protein (DUF952 family)
VIYHIALASDWDAAVEAGEYRISTLGRSLEEEGFVHACFAEQVPGVADAVYAGVTDPLVLLTVDERRLTSPWQVDHQPGSDQDFPHVYGPIVLPAVVMATPLTRDAEGRLELPALP